MPLVKRTDPDAINGQHQPGTKLGRKKIVIKPIDEERARQATYNKRKNGLLKKAIELSVLCKCKVALVVLSETGTKRAVQYTTDGDFDNLSDSLKQMQSSSDVTSEFWTNENYDFFLAKDKDRDTPLGISRPPIIRTASNPNTPVPVLSRQNSSSSAQACAGNRHTASSTSIADSATANLSSGPSNRSNLINSVNNAASTTEVPVTQSGQTSAVSQGNELTDSRQNSSSKPSDGVYHGSTAPKEEPPAEVVSRRNDITSNGSNHSDTGGPILAHSLSHKFTNLDGDLDLSEANLLQSPFGTGAGISLEHELVHADGDIAFSQLVSAAPTLYSAPLSATVAPQPETAYGMVAAGSLNPVVPVVTPAENSRKMDAANEGVIKAEAAGKKRVSSRSSSRNRMDECGSQAGNESTEGQMSKRQRPNTVS